MKSTSTMPESLKGTRRFKVNLWIAAASVMALGLLTYYGVMGVRYWTVSGTVDSLTGNVNELSEEMSQPVDIKGLQADLEAVQGRLDVVRSAISALETDDLISRLSSAARDSGVELVSVTPGGRSASLQEGVLYEVQPVGLSIGGELDDIFDYLSAIFQRVPTVSVSGLAIAGLEGVSTAQVQLIFYLLPPAALRG